MAKQTFQEWLLSEKGRTANQLPITELKYLTNRLWWCWEAATSDGVSHTETSLRVACDNAFKMVHKLQDENKKLKKQLKSLLPKPPPRKCLYCETELPKLNKKWCDQVCRNKYKDLTP